MLDLLDPLTLIKALGLIGVFSIVFIESGLFFGFFFPGDSLLFTAGLLASGGYFSIVWLVLGVIACAVLGGLFGYVFGKQIGPALFSREDSFFFNKKHLQKAHDYYESHGKKTIILGRFLPVVRTFIPIVAGMVNMNLRVFLLFNFIGAVIWTVLLCGLGYYLGKLVPDAERYILPIVIVIVATSFLPAIVKRFKR